jgi:anaphase-promoting complex subunit 2
MLIIQAFTALDSRGVLLDNVSRPIRKYLKGRQDTARIIISSMLTDTSDPRVVVSDLEISVAIADEMLKPINLSAESQRQDSDLDYDNMNYMPQPNDASSDFKKNESSDAISHLFSLYDREQFVTVLQDILGDHLLKYTDDLHLERETHLLELFKARFGEERLQACEVMLRDVTNSRRMNKKIRGIPEYAQGAAAPEVGGTELNAQILSSFFWPDLRDDEFNVPAPVKELQNLYEKGFESHHNLMRLKWLPSLGRATVKLELSDRVVMDIVPTWVASLIYAFNDSSGSGTSPVVKSLDDLKSDLGMDEALIFSGLLYWSNKRVLEEVRPGKYAVIERLPAENPGGVPLHQMQHQQQKEVSAVKSAQDRFDENAHMYKQFVQGMLTNGGNMSLGMMLSMLKVVIPTGFPFGEAELKGLLQGMVDESKLVCQGDVYSVKK